MKKSLLALSALCFAGAFGVAVAYDSMPMIGQWVGAVTIFAAGWLFVEAFSDFARSNFDAFRRDALAALAALMVRHAVLAETMRRAYSVLTRRIQFAPGGWRLAPST